MSDDKRKLTPREAREQAAEATGFLASKEIWIDAECFEVPQRGLLDDDQRERLNDVELESESWDREDDVVIPEQRLKDKDGNETGDVIPGRTVRGALKVPYRKNGKAVKPSYPVRVAIALWGEEKYARFKAGGGRGSDVTAVLAQLDKRLTERELADPKSSGGDVGVETSPDTD